MPFVFFALLFLGCIAYLLYAFFGLLRALDGKKRPEKMSSEPAMSGLGKIPCHTGDELKRVVKLLDVVPFKKEFCCWPASESAEEVWASDGPFSELRYFAMVAAEQVVAYQRELQTSAVKAASLGVLLVDSPGHLMAWTRQMLDYMQSAIDGYSKLLNVHFAKAYGNAEVTTDKEALYNLACAYGYLYCRMISLDYRTRHARTSSQCRKALRNLANLFADATGQVACFPTILLGQIDERIKHPDCKEPLCLTLTPYLDPQLTDEVMNEVMWVCSHWDDNDPTEDDKMLMTLTTEAELNNPSLHIDHANIYPIAVMGDIVDKQLNLNYK